MDTPASTTSTERNGQIPPTDNADAPGAVGPMRCAADPSVETYLRCGRCEKPICPRCLIQTPVGARCRGCAQLRRLPMFDIRPLDYLKAIGGGIAAATAAGIGLLLLRSMLPLAGIFGIMLMAGLGYIVGEAVSRVTRRKQGNPLGIVAALAVPLGLILAHTALFALSGANPLLALVASAVTVLSPAPIWNLFGLLVASAVAFSRAR